MYSSILFLSTFLLLQISSSSAADKFKYLTGQKLNGEMTTFEKYKNKCVLLVNLSPIIPSTMRDVAKLNEFYDEYHDRGLEIVGISTYKWGLFNNRFTDAKRPAKFDVYTSETAQNINQFLKARKKTLNVNDKILIHRNGITLDSFEISRQLNHPSETQQLTALRLFIEKCVSEPKEETSREIPDELIEDAEEIARKKLEELRTDLDIEDITQRAKLRKAAKENNRAEAAMRVIGEEITKFHEQKQLVEEEKKRIEEERIRAEEQKKIAEEQARIAEEQRIKFEEERRLIEEEKRLIENERLRLKQKKLKHQERKRQALEEIEKAALEKKTAELAREAAESEKKNAEEEKRKADEQLKLALEEIQRAEQVKALAAEEKLNAELEKKQAEEATERAIAKKKRAKELKREAQEQVKKAEDETRKAEEEKRKAEEERKRALAEKIRASNKKARAKEEKAKAEEQRKKAEEELAKAELAKGIVLDLQQKLEEGKNKLDDHMVETSGLDAGAEEHHDGDDSDDESEVGDLLEHAVEEFGHHHHHDDDDSDDDYEEEDDHEDERKSPFRH